MDGSLYEDSIGNRIVDGGAPSHSDVSAYYGEILSKSSDLKTNACTTAGAPPLYLQRLLSNIHDDVMSKYYGCGFIAPMALDGLKVLDLGCGSGRDCYVLAQLVGEAGHVVGVDMTGEQITPARATIDWHRQRFGYAEANTTFLTGYIESLGDLVQCEENSFDVIVSNCVINLSPDKAAVLKEAYRLLKPGGELYFSDVYSSQRVPLSLRRDSVLWGECLSGALYWNDFLRLAKDCGFGDPRLVEDSRITISNSKIEDKIGHISFFSATYRLWKLDGLEPDCEDYGQAVRYKGNMPNPNSIPAGSAATSGSSSWLQVFNLDDHHSFSAGRIQTVCGNTYRMLHDTRFAPYFDFFGDFSKHYGIFADCGKSIPFKSAGNSGNTEGVCCASGGSCC